MRSIFFILLIVIIGWLAYKIFILPKAKTTVSKNEANSNVSNTRPDAYVATKLSLKKKAASLKKFAANKGYSTQTVLLADMKMHSGKKRLFVYDMQKDSIITSGLMAHGSCNTTFLQEPKFSNTPNCGCSSVGKYVVGNKYNGRFGTAFKLHGLDSSNNNAFKRFVVLHGYSCVPDKESYPFPICNSLGCPMVSYNFLEKLKAEIATSKKPILLWMFY